MRHRRTFRRTFRRKARVNWLPGIQFSAGGTTIPLYNPDAAPGTNPNKSTIFPLEDTTNMFVAGANRFATANDNISYQRIVGSLRFGLYAGEGIPDPYDHVVSYGIAFVKGEYATDGTWSVAYTDIPCASAFLSPQDTAEKWLFRNEVILNLGNVVGTPAILTTDLIGPYYSHIDIKPRRRALYEEKLCIVVSNVAQADATANLFMNPNLRILTKKWG